MFKLIHTQSNGSARAGILTTPHGQVQTPAFMPVGTKGTVKAMTPEMVASTGAQIVLANTYHLTLRPGEDIVALEGGIQRFMRWDGPVLTDSGGFQVFSLAKISRITEEGVEFRSHLDGSRRMLSPEESMRIQNTLASDIAMAFDECVPFGKDREYTRQSLQRTARWLKRCVAAHDRSDIQALFGIVQGGMFDDLRTESVELTCESDLPGYALGGLSVGESKAQMFDMLAHTTELMPQDKPRYLMGVGSFDALLEGVANGVDMFDCVMQTRMGRTSAALTFTGRLNMRNAAYRRDEGPIDERCTCEVCRKYSRAYLRHLVVEEEILASMLLSWHNIAITEQFMGAIREAILSDTFEQFRLKTLGSWYNDLT